MLTFNTSFSWQKEEIVRKIHAFENLQGLISCKMSAKCIAIRTFYFFSQPFFSPHSSNPFYSLLRILLR